MKTKVAIATLGIGGLLVTGCSTTLTARQQQDEELNTKLAALETRLSETNQRLDEITQRPENLGGSQTKEIRSSQSAAPIKTRTALTTREIQVALKTSGYYAGSVDGKMGPQTLEAIRAFQRSNGLTPDGKVGSKTATALAKQLTQSSNE